MSNYFVYYLSEGKYFYDRNCGTKESAEERVSELKTRYEDSVYLKDHVIKGALY